MTNTLVKKNNTGKYIAIICLALVYILAILLDNFLPATSFTLMLIPVLQKGAIYALLCVSMNLLNGFTGLFSLGQAGFMLIGGYVYAAITIPAAQHDSVYQYFDSAIRFSIPEILSNVIGKGPGTIVGVIISLIIAGLIAALFAFLIGFPVLRLKSDYLAIATLGFAEIIRAVFQWEGLGAITNGSNQLRKYVTLSGMELNFGSFTLELGTLFLFVIVTVCVALVVLLINSSYGRALKAIRDDEIAAEAMGISLFKHKMISFIISSFFAGVGGALLAMFQTTIQANAFKSAMTYEILLMVVIGGIGSISGSCIASFLYIALSEWILRFLDEGSLFGLISVPFFRDGFRKVVFSVVIMIIVLFFSKGIMGDKEISFKGIGGLLTRLKNKKKKTAPAAEAVSEEGEANE
ncbi:MAG: branched-chain amino acid ABC transporter permease [Oscillospiraceae bacterium]|nr:branched-chain amino acid ABC transporter permease [Oscillospiraceae bacterium]